MDKVTECLDALIEEMRESRAYQNYLWMEEELEKDPAVIWHQVKLLSVSSCMGKSSLKMSLKQIIRFCGFRTSLDIQRRFLRSCRNAVFHIS